MTGSSASRDEIDQIVTIIFITRDFLDKDMTMNGWQIAKYLSTVYAVTVNVETITDVWKIHSPT